MKRHTTSARITPRLLGCWLALVAVVGGACSSGASPTGAAVLQKERAPVRHGAPGVSGDDKKVAQDGATITAPGDLPEIDPGPVNKVKSNEKPLDGPRKLVLPWKPEVDVTATLSPKCIVRGRMMTLTVHTEPEAAVAYQAVYADNKGGGDKPLGGGYGGNAGGHANRAGDWSASWVVSTDAPIGRARVDVIIGWEQKWGYTGPEFIVAASPEDCKE